MSYIQTISSQPSTAGPIDLAARRARAAKVGTGTWSILRIEGMPMNDFERMFTQYYQTTAKLNPKIIDPDITKTLSCLYSALSPQSTLRVTGRSTGGLTFNTLFADDEAIFSSITVNAANHPTAGWWGRFTTANVEYCHHPITNKLLCPGIKRSFSNDVWAFIYEGCKASGSPWWTLYMGDKLILGVFSQDWSMVVTVPVITGAEAALQCLAYWLDCARQTDTVSPLHVLRPGTETYGVWLPNEFDNALPPSRIARLLDQSSQRASASSRNTRSRTVARKAFVSYDDKTGQPIVTQLADDHVEDMRAKSLMMRTGDDAGWNISVNAQSSGNSAESEQRVQSDPDTKMDADPQTSPDLDSRSLSLAPQELADPGADFDQVSLIEPGNEEKAVFTWELKREHFYKWHREHFSIQDDLDCSDPWSYLKLANAKFN